MGIKHLLTEVQLLELVKVVKDYEIKCCNMNKEEIISHCEVKLPAHIQDMFRRTCGNICGPEILFHSWLLNEFSDIFAKDDLDLGCFKGLKHTIDTGDSPPIKKRYRRTPLAFEKEEKAHLKKMLEIGVITSSNSDWSFPPVLIRKKDGSLRWCLDYRDLNYVTRKDCFGIPNISECTDFLSDLKYLSSVDMVAGYWQIEIEEKDRHKTAFSTKYGLFEHTRMAFGLCNAPSSFQRVMSMVLKGMLWHEILAYLDDVVIKGKDFMDHVINLFRTMSRFRQHNLKLKPKKCNFFEQETVFLGHLITPQGIKVNPANVENVLNWPVPKCVKNVESLLGFANYHRNHIKNYAEVTHSLYQLTGPKAIFVWEAEHEKAFKEICELLVSAPFLAFPDLGPDSQWVLDCDASNSCIGGVLSQIVDGEEKVVSYGSFVLTPCQRKYCTTRYWL